jgi:hypothetical protein
MPSACSSSVSQHGADDQDFLHRSQRQRTGALQQWNGTQVEECLEWMSGDRAMVHKMVEESAGKYAAEKNITPACLKG